MVSGTTVGKLKFKVDEKQLDKDVKNAILKHLKGKMVIVANRSSKRIQENFSRLLLDSDTIKSLSGGQLTWEFGFDDISVRISDILNQWINSMRIEHKPLKIIANGLVGGFTINMVKSDWSDVIDRESAIFTTPEHNYDLRWLEWLLIEGGKTIIADYDFVGRGGLGRLEHGLMVKNARRKRWSVPSEFQGTTDNNFVTQVINEVYVIIAKIFTEEFNRVL